jgi:hypothetical protein
MPIDSAPLLRVAGIHQPGLPQYCSARNWPMEYVHLPPHLGPPHGGGGDRDEPSYQDWYRVLLALSPPEGEGRGVFECRLVA